MYTIERNMLKKRFQKTQKLEIEAHIQAYLGCAFEISRKVARPGRRQFFLGGFEENHQDTQKLGKISYHPVKD